MFARLTPFLRLETLGIFGIIALTRNYIKLLA